MDDPRRLLTELRARHEIATSHDPVTGLANRATVCSRLDAILKDPASTGAAAGGDGGHREATVMVVKIDDFDGLRNRYGSDETNVIVANLARAVRAETNVGDTIGVASVDEFVVVTAPGRRRTEIEDLAQRLLDLADLRLTSRDQRASVQMYVGVGAVRSGDLATIVVDEIGRAARSGCTPSGPPCGTERGNRNRIVFQDTVRRHIDTRVLAAASIEQALLDGEMELYYQPILDVNRNRIAGFEGLLRWIQPRGQITPAGRFLPAVEGTATMLDLGDFVLERGCTQLATWQRRHGTAAPTLSLNMSARQLRQGGFAARVRCELERAGADPGGLCLELTETHAVEFEPWALSELRSVRELGVSIALDDFGTGYSTLHHLQEIEADTIKIDRAFIDRLGSDPGATAIIRASLELGAAFGMNAVAEGVTTEAQCAELATMGCGFIQGHLVAPALPLAEADAMLGHPMTTRPSRAPITTASS